MINKPAFDEQNQATPTDLENLSGLFLVYCVSKAFSCGKRWQPKADG